MGGSVLDYCLDTSGVTGAHLFWVKTIKFLDKTLVTHHLNPQIKPQKWLKKITPQKTKK